MITPLLLLTLFSLTCAAFLLEATDDQGNSLKMRIRRETSSKFYDLLREARMQDGGFDINAALTQNVQDPVPLADFNVSSSGIFTNVFGQFRNLKLHGLSDFRVDKVTMNLSQMNLSAVMFLPSLNIEGDYSLDGTITFLPLSGEGAFWMNMSHIDMQGHSLLNITPQGRLAMEKIHLSSQVGDIQLNFENLMGGGTWGTISNSILNQLSELIVGELKHTLLSELSSFMRHQFNEVVFQQLPMGFLDPETTTLVDNILGRATRYIAENDVEPLRLPDHREAYEKNFFFVTTRGELNLFNGTLDGLSTLYRKGDVITVFANNSLLFEANFGFENLTGGYSWQAEVFGTGPRGIIDIQIKSVEGFIKLRQDLSAGSKLVLDTLHVNDIRQIWFDIQGLGRWDYIMETIVNLVTNGLKMQLADAIAEPVKKSVQRELDLLPISIPSDF